MPRQWPCPVPQNKVLPVAYCPDEDWLQQLVRTGTELHSESSPARTLVVTNTWSELNCDFPTGNYAVVQSNTLRHMRVLPEWLADLSKALERPVYCWKSMKRSCCYFVHGHIETLDCDRLSPNIAGTNRLENEESTFGTSTEPARRGAQ